MADQTKNEIIMRDGRFFRRTLEEVDLGDVDLHLSQCIEAKTLPLMHVSRVGLLPELVKLIGTPAIHAIWNETNVTFAVALPFLSTRVFYRLSQDGLFLEPAFASANTMHGYICMRERWTNPMFQPVFVMRCAYRHSPSMQIAPDDCYLHLRHKDNPKRFIVPHWPNVYNNGKVCMGSEWDHNKSRGHPANIEIFENAIHSFMTTVMNDHLTSGYTVPLFKRRVTEDGSQWSHPKTDDGSYGVEGTAAFLSSLVTMPYHNA